MRPGLAQFKIDFPLEMIQLKNNEWESREETVEEKK